MKKPLLFLLILVVCATAVLIYLHIIPGKIGGAIIFSSVMGCILGTPWKDRFTVKQHLEN